MTDPSRGHATLPPGASPRARRILRILSIPVERFLHVQAASGIILLLSAAAALALANSRLAPHYEHLLHAPVVIGIGERVFRQSVHFWVNDVLMVIFFFVVGLEVRREIFEGALSSLRRATLPVAAAVGGMVAPALIYVGLNRGTAAAGGWGVPMATDIAFAVGVLALLGRRIDPNLRVLLLALAIIDDIGAILVIAFFYSSGVTALGLGLAGGGIAAVIAMQRVGIRSPVAYIPPGILLWAGTLQAGIHPTIAGVILGLLTPARSWFGTTGFVAEAQAALDHVRGLPEARQDPHTLLPHIRRVAQAAREALPPVSRLEAALHPWVAYGVMPIFALANAGVALDGLGDAPPEATRLALGVTLGLVVGKPAGILALSWLAVRARLADLPPGVSWPGVGVVGAVAGIGFTMSLFIGTLAFPDAALLAVAKAAVLTASGVSGVLGLLAGLIFLRPPPSPVSD